MKQHDRRIQELHKLYQIEDAKLVLDWMAGRAKNSFETLLDKLVETVSLERVAAISVLRKFEDIGLGKLIIGRRGSKTRFIWAVGLVTAGQTAQGKMNILETLPEIIEDETPLFQGSLRTWKVTIELTPDQIQQIVDAAIR